MSDRAAFLLAFLLVAMIGGAASGLVIALTDRHPTPRVHVDCTSPCMVDPGP